MGRQKRPEYEKLEGEAWRAARVAKKKEKSKVFSKQSRELLEEVRVRSRTLTLEVALNKEELTLLEAKCVRAGFSNVGDYLRFVAIHGVLDAVNIKFYLDASEFTKEVDDD